MQISNTVATATLNTPLDLEYLQEHLPGSVLQKSTGHWLKYRLQPENRYIAFYRSGKFLLTGKGVVEDQDSLVQRVLDLIRTAGIQAEVIALNINNIVAKDKIDLPASLETIYEAFDQKKIEYEPEQFPALIFRDWGLTFLIFSTGSIIITGAKTVESLEQGLRKLKEMMGRVP